jgi:hypothetical protein
VKKTIAAALLALALGAGCSHETWDIGPSYRARYTIGCPSGLRVTVINDVLGSRYLKIVVYTDSKAVAVSTDMPVTEINVRTKTVRVTVNGKTIFWNRINHCHIHENDGPPDSELGD